MIQNLLMITGLGSAQSLASGKQGAFYYTLQEFHGHWNRIDIIAPRTTNDIERTDVFFGNVYVHNSGWPLILHPIFFIKKGLELWKKNRFDLMTVHEFPPFYNGIAARILHWLTGAPYILEIMHVPGLPRASSMKETVYRWLTRSFISFDAQGARAVRIINQNQTKDFLIRSGVPASKLHYIPAFYIDHNIFKPLGTDKKYDLVYAARLERNKGIINLVKAIKILKNKKPDISLLIVGSGPLRPKLESFIKCEGLENNIVFSGWLETVHDVAKAYNSCRVFVNPSMNEGGPRVALEAMACGLPVITTPVGIMLDVIQDGENGVISGFGPHDLSKAIERMLNNPALMEECSASGIKTAGQFERSAAISYYAQELKRLSKKRLLVITQRVDEKDQLLGFFIDWIRRLGERTSLSVLALQKGTFHLPSFISVSSLGKEQGILKPVQIYRFFKYIFGHSGEYDAVFVHMNPIWAVLGGWYWRLAGKKVILWYTHKSVTFKLRVASRFADVILTASPESFRLRSSKVIVTGHGIDTELFKPSPERVRGRKILTVGRIAPVKNYEVLIEALRLLKNQGVDPHLSIAGEPALGKDRTYLRQLQVKIQKDGLQDRVTFLGRIDHALLPAVYNKHDLFVHMSKTGSLDKSLLEAMASGLQVISSNDAAKSFLSQKDIFDENDADQLAEKIKMALDGQPDAGLRDIVIKNHNLQDLIEKILIASS